LLASASLIAAERSSGAWAAATAIRATDESKATRIAMENPLEVFLVSKQCALE